MSNMIDHVDMPDYEEVLQTPVYTSFTDPRKEWHDRALIQTESGMTVDILREMARHGALPARGTVHYRSLFQDALATCMARLFLADEAQFCVVSRRMPQTEAEIGRLHDLLSKVKLEQDGGFTDWERTVFETIRTREHLYEDEFSIGPVNAYPGFIRMDRALQHLSGAIDMDRARTLAFGWLEGDDSAEPLNKPKTRHRENGDWILVFDRAWFPGLDSRIETVTVVVTKEAFEEHSLEDRDLGSWYKVELRRGRKVS